MTDISTTADYVIEKLKSKASVRLRPQDHVSQPMELLVMVSMEISLRIGRMVEVESWGDGTYLLRYATEGAK